MEGYTAESPYGLLRVSFVDATHAEVANDPVEKFVIHGAQYVFRARFSRVSAGNWKIDNDAGAFVVTPADGGNLFDPQTGTFWQCPKQTAGIIRTAASHALAAVVVATPSAPERSELANIGPRLVQLEKDHARILADGEKIAQIIAGLRRRREILAAELSR